MRFLKAASAWLAYSFSVALISFRIAAIISLSDILLTFNFSAPKQAVLQLRWHVLLCQRSNFVSKSLHILFFASYLML